MAYRMASGTVVEAAADAVRFTAELGNELRCELTGKTVVYRGSERADARALCVGDEVWVAFRPGPGNRAAWVKAAPDPEIETAALKEQLARAVRMLVMEGLVAFSGHVSGRLPRRGTFLIHPAAVPRSEVCPADFCEVDLAGEQLSGPCAAPDETAIHAAVYRVRSDVNAVLHLHPHYSILPSLVGKDLIPICGHGAIFGRRIPVYPRQEKIVRRQDADRMATLLGEGRAVILRGHGAVVAEGTVEAVFTAALYLEENARLLSDALSVGTPVPMTDDELQAAYEEAYLPTSVAKTWDFYERKGWKTGIFQGLKGMERS